VRDIKWETREQFAIVNGYRLTARTYFHKFEWVANLLGKWTEFGKVDTMEEAKAAAIDAMNRHREATDL